MVLRQIQWKKITCMPNNYLTKPPSWNGNVYPQLYEKSLVKNCYSNVTGKCKEYMHCFQLFFNWHLLSMQVWYEGSFYLRSIIILLVGIQLYQHDSKLEKREIVRKHDQFPISTSVGVTVYQYGKIFYIYFIILHKKHDITSTDERREMFWVYIKLCKHGS